MGVHIGDLRGGGGHFELIEVTGEIHMRIVEDSRTENESCICLFEKETGDDTRDLPRNDALNLDEGNDTGLALIFSFKLEIDKFELPILRAPKKNNTCVELPKYPYFLISIPETSG